MPTFHFQGLRNYTVSQVKQHQNSKQFNYNVINRYIILTTLTTIYLTQTKLYNKTAQFLKKKHKNKTLELSANTEAVNQLIHQNSTHQKSWKCLI